MNARMGGVLTVLTALLVSRGAFAYDADTLALYTFCEKTGGAAVASGETIVNAANGSAHAGTVVAVGTPVATDTLLYDAADVPGKYVFETNAFGAVAVVTNAQALAWNRADSTGTARGLSIDFADVANTLSGLDEWTIELFAAWPSETASLHTSYCGNMYFNAGATIDGTTAVGTSVNLGVSQSFVLIWNDLPTTIWSHYGKTTHYTILRYGDKSPLNGQWHHVAIVYRRSTNQYKCYYDYGLSKYSLAKVQTLACTNLPVTASSPLQLGLGRMVGKVFCPRVTKRALAPEQFLHASNDPEYLPRTVFHLSFEGKNGDEPAVFTNIASSATAFGTQYIPNCYPQSAAYNPNLEPSLDWSAHAEPYAPSGTTVPPVLTNCVCKKRAGSVGWILDGTNTVPLCRNDTSVLEDCTENATTNKGACVSARVPRVSALDYPLVKRGSFTMEGFVKLDYNRFLARSHLIDIYERGETPTYNRFCLFGVDLGDGPDFGLAMQYYDPYKKWCLMCVTWEKNDDGTRRYNGSSVWSEQFKGDYNNVLLDDKWHHVAAVYDDTTLKVTVYVDYQVQITGTYKYPFVLQASTRSDFYVGGTLYGQAMPGCYDHFRYSRVALKPSQFLKAASSTSGFCVFFK